jgi:hypothetical protein
MPCKTHGWRSKVCPECLYHQEGDFYRKQVQGEAIPTCGPDALEAAITAIDATTGQARLLRAVATMNGYAAALIVARQWQEPLPLPKVTICAA